MFYFIYGRKKKAAPFRAARLGLIVWATFGHSLTHGCGAILCGFVVTVIPVDAGWHGRW